MKISAFTVDGIPMIQKDDDLAAIIAAHTDIQDHDIVVIASTIVAKAEARRHLLSEVTPTPKAEELALLNNEDPRFIQFVLNNSTKILMKHPLLVQTVYGNICINAGIDRSNTETGYILLLPEDSDTTARKLRDRFKELTGKKVAVIITDTNGRSFRDGQMGVAIGCAGIAAMHDRRGDVDLYGHELKITIQGITDEVAACANMIMGEANEGTPVAIVRGYKYLENDDGIKVAFRPDETDYVKKALIEMMEREEKAQPAVDGITKKMKTHS